MVNDLHCTYLRKALHLMEYAKYSPGPKAKGQYKNVGKRDIFL